MPAANMRLAFTFAFTFIFILPLHAEDSPPLSEPPSLNAASVSDDVVAPVPTVLILEEQLGLGYRGRGVGIKLKHRLESEYNVAFYYDATNPLGRTFSLILEVRHVQPLVQELLFKSGALFSVDQSTTAATPITISRFGPSWGIEKHWAPWFSSELNLSPIVFRIQDGFHFDGARVTLGAYLHVLEKWKEVAITAPAAEPTIQELRQLNIDN